MKILLALLFIFCFIGCKKDRSYHTIIEGRVLNYGSRQPIDSAIVSLQDGVGATSFVDYGSTSSDKRAVAYTNSSGEFRIELSGEFNACLSLRKDKYDWDDPQDGDGIMGFNDGHYQNVELLMKAEAYFDPIMASKNLTFARDAFYLDILARNNYSDFIENGDRYFATGLGFKYYGIGPFSYSYHLSVGDTYQPFRTTLTRDGVKTVKTDSVFIKSFETFSDTIYY